MFARVSLSLLPAVSRKRRAVRELVMWTPSALLPVPNRTPRRRLRLSQRRAAPCAAAGPAEFVTQLREGASALVARLSVPSGGGGSGGGVPQAATPATPAKAVQQPRRSAASRTEAERALAAAERRCCGCFP